MRAEKTLSKLQLRQPQVYPLKLLLQQSQVDHRELELCDNKLCARLINKTDTQTLSKERLLCGKFSGIQRAILRDAAEAERSICKILSIYLQKLT